MANRTVFVDYSFKYLAHFPLCMAKIELVSIAMTDFHLANYLQMIVTMEDLGPIVLEASVHQVSFQDLICQVDDVKMVEIKMDSAR